MICLLGKNGNALLYSTHHRGTSNLLRGRNPSSTARQTNLSEREHQGLRIPRITNEQCLQGLLRNASSEPSFWTAVLRGRIPALFLLDERNVETYASNVFEDSTSESERKACLAAVITGRIDDLPNERNLFRAYSYMSERFRSSTGALYAWPLFAVVQENVLGKDYSDLRAPFLSRTFDSAKVFEAVLSLPY